MVIITPAVLTTKQCHDYVAGSRVWDELLAAHSDILRPIRTVPRGDSFWRRKTIDEALIVAEERGSLLAPPNDQRKSIIKRKARGH